MPRNKSEQEPTIEGASDALMLVLRTDAVRATPADDGLYEALSREDKEYYAGLHTHTIDDWARELRVWREAKLAKKENSDATQPK